MNATTGLFGSLNCSIRQQYFQTVLFRSGCLLIYALLTSICASASVIPITQKDWLPAIEEFKSETDVNPPDDELLRILWKYAPDSFYIIHRTSIIPAAIKFDHFDFQIGRAGDAMRTEMSADGSKVVTRNNLSGFRRWIFDSDPVDQVLDLDTATHEEKHRYTADFSIPLLAEAVKGDSSLLGSDEYADHRMMSYFSYYLGRHRTRFNRIYPTFPVREIADYVPQEYRTGRYDIYIAGEGPGQELGIFSTLDEYNATYWSQRTVFDLYRYFQTELPQTSDTWLKYFARQAGTFDGWAEYRYFMLTYLMYARDKHPDVFQRLLADSRFRETFTELDDQYIELHKRVIERLSKELPAYLSSRGLKTSVFMYTDPKNAKARSFVINVDKDGRAIFWWKYQMFSQKLRTPAYMAMANQFRTTPSPELPMMADDPTR